MATVSRIHASPLPDDSLLGSYARDGAFTDCYHTDIDAGVGLADYVEAFYSGRLFGLERLLIRLFLSRPSTRADIRRLGRGEIDGFAAWRVEARTPDQLLLCDIAHRTRSWLMVQAAPGGNLGTRLYFGSAVIPASRDSTGKPRMGWLFNALLGFHRLYSRLLLGAARRRLLQRNA